MNHLAPITSNDNLAFFYNPLVSLDILIGFILRVGTWVVYRDGANTHREIFLRLSSLSGITLLGSILNAHYRDSYTKEDFQKVV